jgi:hypothetical protein
LNENDDPFDAHTADEEQERDGVEGTNGQEQI